MNKKRGKSYILAWIFGVLCIVLSGILVFSAFIIVKLQRNNMFSKSILLNNNYFMDQLMYDLSNESDEGNEKGDEQINVYMDKYREYLLWVDGGTLQIVSEEVDPEIARRVTHINELLENEAPGHMNSISIANMIVNKMYEVYELHGITSEADREIEEFLSQFGIMIELESISNSEKLVLDVPYLSQEGILPNGCEAVSATMLLQNMGFDISPEIFVDDYLECGETSIRFGCRVGPNPKEMYAGDPRSEDGGFGCFAPVIVRALNNYLPDGYYAKNTTGLSLETLKRRYIDNGIPVAVWVTVGMEEVDRILQWQSDDGEETYLYPANEHCMVFVGYDSDNYIFADPYGSNGILSYPIDDCVLAFNMLGSQSAVVIETQK